MCPFRVSIGQMRGTTSSSWTLFKVTHTPAISESHASPNRLRSSFRWSLSLVAVVLLLSICFCDAKRTHGINTNKKSYHSQPPPPAQERRSNNQAVIQEDSDSNVNHDLDEFYVDEKEEDVKTVRFRKKKPHSHASSSEKRSDNHHPTRIHHQQHHPSNPKPNWDDVDEEDIRNQMKQRQNGNQDSSYNADSATFEEIEIPLEPLKKGDGLDPRELKHFIEDVAESILAEADRLYGVIESGSGVGLGDSTSALQLSSSFDVGNYIICQ